jgi:mannose-6-phosphate isomerase-like protein (cupin superfamily)
VAKTGDTLPAPDGTTFLVVQSARDSGGDRVEFEIRMPSGALGPPRHRHPSHTETLRVVEGELSVYLDEGWRTLTAGEELEVPPQTMHTLRNQSGSVVRFRDIHEPGLSFQEYIEALSTATTAGGMDGTASRLLHGAAILRAHRESQVSASPVQRIGEDVLSLVGRVLP